MTLTIEQINQLLQQLGEIPYKYAAPIINSITEEFHKQQTMLNQPSDA